MRPWRRDYVNDDDEDKTWENFPLNEVSKFSSPSLYINFKPDEKKKKEAFGERRKPEYLEKNLQYLVSLRVSIPRLVPRQKDRRRVES